MTGYMGIVRVKEKHFKRRWSGAAEVSGVHKGRKRSVHTNRVAER